jgi:hypothetical protein
MKQIYSGEHGFIAEFDPKLDLSNSYDTRLVITGPLGHRVERNLPPRSYMGGLLRFVVEEGDFPGAGVYHLQAHDLSKGRSLAGRPFEVVVRPAL